jgi:signal transduction histidine kinase
MFESLQHRKFVFAPVDSGAGNKTSAKRQGIVSRLDLTADIEELKKVNGELREARRAAFNLLEDAQQTESRLANDLGNMRLLTRLAQELVSDERLETYYDSILNTVIALTKADAGTFQLLNKETQQLEMVASKGFEKNFINYFEFVGAKSNTSCGIALRTKERVLIDFDVPPGEDPDGSLRMHVEEGILSAQSTPLISHSGNTIGMVTTHFRKHYRPGEHELYFIDLVARMAADMIDRKKAEAALRESEERLRRLNASLEQKVLERTKELSEKDTRLTNLNESLFAMNREMHALNSELKTFTTVAGTNYRETLRHLYIHLETIVMQDARHLSNSSRANLRRAQGAVQKMKLLTEDLIEFSKLHEIGSKEENVDLNRIFQTALSDFTSKAIHAQMDISCEELPSISGSTPLLSLLFHHLLDNAIKFRKTDKDHKIKITCQELENDEHVNDEGIIENSTYWVIRIADNGIGFDQEESEKIFDMFYQSQEKGKYKGSGVGLAICKKIMEMHGGFLIAESKPGEGAAFSCYFPSGHTLIDSPGK